MSLKTLIEKLGDFDTALIANTIGYIDKTPVHEWYMGGSIASLTPSVGPTVGVAMTCEVDSSTPAGGHDFELYYELLEAIRNSAAPVVVVAKAVGSRPDHECIIGDGTAKMMNSYGGVGLVTDGGVRDIEGILTVPFGVYAKGRTIHHCGVRFKRINVPVEVGGITVNPGDLIHANRGEESGLAAEAFEGVLKRQAVDHGGGHSHVVSGRLLDHVLISRERRAPEDVPAADHDRELNAAGRDP